VSCSDKTNNTTAPEKDINCIVTDIGSDFYISGAPDDRWNNDDLNQLKNVKATDF
jgi:hypothetical protein